MGKKNKNKFSHFDYMGMGKGGKVLDRYEVSGIHYGHPDGRSGKPNRTMETVDRELAKAASQDYDTRRTLEARALAGDEKAENWAKNSFKNAGDVLAANNYFKKLHKKNGNGGDFSSLSDFAGLTWDSVKQDRDQLLSSMEGSGGNKDKDTDTLVPFAKGPIEPSAHLQAVNDRLSVGVPKLYDEQADYMSPPAKDDEDEAARLFKQQYAADVTAGLNIREDRKLNLHNAMYSA